MLFWSLDQRAFQSGLEYWCVYYITPVINVCLKSYYTCMKRSLLKRNSHVQVQCKRYQIRIFVQFAIILWDRHRNPQNYSWNFCVALSIFRDRIISLCKLLNFVCNLCLNNNWVLMTSFKIRRNLESTIFGLVNNLRESQFAFLTSDLWS